MSFVPQSFHSTFLKLVNKEDACVLSNRILPHNSLGTQGQWWYSVWFFFFETSVFCLASSSQGGVPFLRFWFSFNNPCLLGVTLSTQVESFYLNCILRLHNVKIWIIISAFVINTNSTSHSLCLSFNIFFCYFWQLWHIIHVIQLTH